MSMKSEALKVYDIPQEDYKETLRKELKLGEEGKITKDWFTKEER